MPGTSNSGGRNAKSPAEHRAQGTYQPVRHAGFENPEPPTGQPAMPKSLKGDARDAWLQMVWHLEQCKTISTVDGMALYQFAELWSETQRIQKDHERIRTLSAKLMKEIRSLKGSELMEAVGEIIKLELVLSKHVTQLRQGHMALRQYLIEFGMTPSARNRVKIPGGDAKQPSKLLSFRGGKTANAESDES